MRLSLPLLLAAACAVDPAAQDAHAYVSRLQPALIENGFLADRLLGLSARIYNKQADAATLDATWRSEIVPLAEHLHDQASFVAAPSDWTKAHADLVDIWGDRAQAYRSLGRAIDEGDKAAWNEARELADSVKLREEEWFRTTNQRLSAHDLLVDAFP
ncbi:MAG: hypothetical protein H0V89_13955 [Deltaproteobacteria bacterium]|nr:hypothetical protein [Deltaproteobacteria bacterium]